MCLLALRSGNVFGYLLVIVGFYYARVAEIFWILGTKCVLLAPRSRNFLDYLLVIVGSYYARAAENVFGH